MPASIALASLACAGVLVGEEIRETRQAYRVFFTDGGRERYEVLWGGAVIVDKSESGGPAAPLHGKFVDDRRCHWTIRTVVSRRVYRIGDDGERHERRDGAAVLDAASPGGGASYRFESGRTENCNDAEPRFRANLEDARRSASAALESVVRTDQEKVVKMMKAWPRVARVEREAGSNPER